MPRDDVERLYPAVGPRRFSTKSLPPLAPSSAEDGHRPGTSHRRPPRTASRRAYLRAALPAVYQDGKFGLRFVGELESLLDPIVALLDALPAHFDADLAPRHILELIAGWLGVELDEGWTQGRQGDLVGNAADLARRRGTKTGLELLLRLTFPGLPLHVEDRGGVTWGSTRSWPADPGNADDENDEAGFIVKCDVLVSEEQQAVIARVVEAAKPAHVSYGLLLEAPLSEGDGGWS